MPAMTRALAAFGRELFSDRSAHRLDRYLHESRRPVHALAFLLPLVIWYEVWSWYVSRAGNGDRALVAHSALRGLLEWFGIVGFWVPGVVLVIALVVRHTQRRERWRLRVGVPPLMALESVLAALPLLALAGLFAQARDATSGELKRRLMFALGAGIYEELVFRMLLIAGLIWLATELVHLPRRTAFMIAIPLAAVGFALCHVLPVGFEEFRWGSFWFRVVAGLYLTVLYLGRGLGIAAGGHAAYNVALALLR
jgi:hypothetical protein